MEKNFINIVLPGGTSPEDVAEIKKSISDIEDVNAVEQIGSRNLDAGSVMLWVQTVGSIITVAGTAIPVINKVVDIVRRKNLSNVKIKVADDIEISIDESSAKDIQQILESITKKK